MTRILPLLALVLFAVSCTPTDSSNDAPDPTEAFEGSTTVATAPGQSFAGTVEAPEFPVGLEWINTAEPVSLNDLRGKVVILDFWTYGCINCIHVIPDLKRLEAEFPDELVVIGVHSAKFTNEGDTAQIREVVQRYGIEHPVVNDADFVVWSNWGANAWPTTAVIDPAGKAVGIRSGEGVYDAVQPVVAGLVAEFGAAGALNTERIEFALESDSAPLRALSYPGKVLAEGDRLWIADTGHNRILEVDPTTGDVLAAYGSGEQGANDGTALEASFNAPQGLTFRDGILYVADTDNHLIRAIELTTGAVTTVAGTGELGYPAQAGLTNEVALNSPWAVLVEDTTLYIANAGSHQILSIGLDTGLIAPLIGNARESTTNGSFANAELAQPSGLALSDDGVLYFADSESSSIRAADLTTETTFLVVGGDANLFEFGDTDGGGNAARLQHPLGTALAGSTLYIADTYNSKIKKIDVTSNTVTSWLGSEPGWADGSNPMFNEPGGLSIAGSTLYIADTNNHSIRVVDIETGVTSTLILKGIEKFDPPTAYNGVTTNLDPISANAGVASVIINYQLPGGYKVNEDAPSSLTITTGGNIISLPTGPSFDLTGTNVPVSVAVDLAEGEGTVTLDVTLIYCKVVATSLCLIDQARFVVPLEVGAAGPSVRISLDRVIPDPNI